MCGEKSEWFEKDSRRSRITPRVCGEKQTPRLSQSTAQGSPPRVRGKVYKCVQAHTSQGITPACAGKSKRGKPRFQRSEDHPRVCGEKSEWFEKDSRRSRITPACAGKRVDLSRTPKPAQDHPRVCGEKATHGGNILSRLGSPPRVRGKGLALRLATRRLGITPACAGKRVGTS